MRLRRSYARALICDILTGCDSRARLALASLRCVARLAAGPEVRLKLRTARTLARATGRPLYRRALVKTAKLYGSLHENYFLEGKGKIMRARDRYRAAVEMKLRMELYAREAASRSRE